jgi:CheY-like chemotaxis protein
LAGILLLSNRVFSNLTSAGAKFQAGPACPLHKSRVLVVDDEKSLTALVAMLLEQHGSYIVRVENSAANALAAAQQFHPDLILMDIAMPDLDGGQVVGLIRADPALNSIPVVFLTATVTHLEVKQNGGCIGGLRFLAKPFRSDELMDCIAQQLAE